MKLTLAKALEFSNKYSRYTYASYYTSFDFSHKVYIFLPLPSVFTLWGVL